MSASGRSAFLIVEPDVLIADDLRQTLSVLAPRAAIHVTRDAEAAAVLLGQVERLSAAFLNLPSRDLLTGGLPQEVERRGGRVVVLDAAVGAAEATGADGVGCDRAGWLYTGRPYAAHTIAAALLCMGLAPASLASV